MAVRTWLPIMLSTAATPSITLCPSCCCRTMLPKRKIQMRGYFFRATRCSYLAVDNIKTLSERSGTAPLLEKLRNKFIQETTTTPKSPRYPKPSKNPKPSSPSLQEPENDVEMTEMTKKGEFSASLTLRKSHRDDEDNDVIEKRTKRVEYVPSSFSELPLSEEVLGAVEELNISVPTEVQALGIRAILRGQSIFLASHTGSGKTLAYLLPIVQLLRKDEAETGLQLKPKRPRAMVLCPTRELCEQVYHVAKSIAHRARFRSVMLGGGVPIRGQEEALAKPIDMVFGTPGRILKHIEKENLFYGDVKYVVLDEADTMFDEGFGPDLRKFLTPLRKRAAKTDVKGGFQSVLVSATCTKDVQELLDEEFKGIKHIHTSTLHKRIDTARHEFIKIAGSENKLETLLQVLEPSLSKGNKVMVFCNTLGSSRAIDHYLAENDIVTLNYHGAVPAEQRVESLNEFRNGTDTRATLVCTDLAARGLDLAVDHVIMFDFPHNPIDYLHRTGRTARMGAEGRVTSLVTKRDEFLASKIEDAVRKNEDFDSISLVRDSPAVARSSGRKDTNKSPTTSGNPKARSATSRVDGLKARSRTSPNKGKYTVSGHEGKERPFQKKERKTIVGLKGKTRTLGKERKKLKVTTSIGKQKTKDVKAKLSSATKNAYPKSRFEGFETGASNASVKKKSKSKRKPKSTNKVWKDETPASSKLSVVSFKGKKSSKSS